ncbi:MAG: hypothetical protein AB4426_04945 [Xenococcaceae cyanobacterium]
MPGYLLNVSSTVLCAHGGQAKATVSNPRVKVIGQPTVTQVSPYAIAGCANPPPPANVGPCITATWTTASVRVKSMGMPLLLQDSKALCTPTGTPLNVIPIPTRVKGI